MNFLLFIKVFLKSLALFECKRCPSTDSFWNRDSAAGGCSGIGFKQYPGPGLFVGTAVDMSGPEDPGFVDPEALREREDPGLVLVFWHGSRNKTKCTTLGECD